VSALAAAAASGSAVAGVVGVRCMLVARSGRRSAHPRRLPRAIVSRTARGAALERSLRRAGIPLGVDAVVAGIVVGAATAGSVLWLVVRSPAGMLVGAAAVIAGAAARVRSAERRYLARFSAQLPAVAQHLASSLGAGLSLRQAVDRAANDAPQPAAAELGTIADDLRLGARMEDALSEACERLPDPGLRLMATTILIQRTVGGNLARGLAALSAQLEHRASLAREVAGATAQARMSAWLVAALPLAGGVLVEISAPGTLARTVGRGPGLVLLVLATALELAGIVLIGRVVRRIGEGG
jgi:tight adherence protein B